MSSSTDEKSSAMLKEIQNQGQISLPSDKAPKDATMAAALTQHAINNLGGPIFASMTDHAPVDTALAQAKTMITIQRRGSSHVAEGKGPADRAINEALTLGAITSGKAKDGLKETTTTGGAALTPEQLAQIQADAAAEKKDKEAARVFGGGDAKETMVGLLAEIGAQKGATISVPLGKAPESNISLNHTKTLMEIENMKGNAIFASQQDHKPKDTALAQAQLLHAISHKGEAKVGTVKVDRAINEALTLKALEKPAQLKHVDAPASSPALDQALLMQAVATKKKPSLKSVDKPAEGLSKEKIAEFQKLALEEKAEKPEDKSE